MTKNKNIKILKILIIKFINGKTHVFHQLHSSIQDHDKNFFQLRIPSQRISPPFPTSYLIKIKYYLSF